MGLSSGSTEVFSPCFTSYSSAPGNTLGYQQAFDQNNYAGFLAMYGIGSREYIQVMLNDSMEKDYTYCVRFFYSVGDISDYSCGGVGVYFSSDSVSVPFDTDSIFRTLPYTPQVQFPDSLLIFNKDDWQLFSEEFVAQGGERFLTLGYFKKPSQAYCVEMNDDFIQQFYLYIDSVSVVQCAEPNGYLNINRGNRIEIFPNPASNQITIFGCAARINLLSTIGQIVKSTFTTNGHQAVLDVSDLPNGLYVVEIIGEALVVTRSKVVVLH